MLFRSPVSTRSAGLTLVELMVGTALLVGGGGALLVGMHYSRLHSDYLTDFQVAMNSAQGRLEELAATSFDILLTGNEYVQARTAAGQCRGLGEDRNCNGILDPGEDINGNNTLDEPLRGARLNIRVRPTPGMVNQTLLDLHVAACWTSGTRRIGEDLNCNGQMDNGEDPNGNGFLDSPAMVSTRVAVRQ